jgi:hypothetical protein
MNRPLFMRRYTMFFESIRQNPSNPHIDADTLKWLPLMYITVSDRSRLLRPSSTKADVLDPSVISACYCDTICTRGDGGRTIGTKVVESTILRKFP